MGIPLSAQKEKGIVNLASELEPGRDKGVIETRWVGSWATVRVADQIAIGPRGADEAYDVTWQGGEMEWAWSALHAARRNRQDVVSLLLDLHRRQMWQHF